MEKDGSRVAMGKHTNKYSYTVNVRQSAAVNTHTLINKLELELSGLNARLS